MHLNMQTRNEPTVTGTNRQYGPTLHWPGSSSSASMPQEHLFLAHRPQSLKTQSAQNQAVLDSTELHAATGNLSVGPISSSRTAH